MSISGNIKGIIQVKHFPEDENGNPVRNSIGEIVMEWKDAQTIRGWLDLASGSSHYTTYASKVQESTHVFVADYVPIADSIQAENSRMTVNGKTYDIMLIDNPMELNQQLEIYLKHTGVI